MKRGFTLIEILIALVIMAIIVGTAVASVGAGMKAARLSDAARAVQQYARHAKAVALLKQRPVVLTFEEIVENGAFVKSRVSMTFSSDAPAADAGASGGAGFGVGGTAAGEVRTLSGKIVGVDVGDEAPLQPGGGEAPDPLAAGPREFEGIRIHAEDKENRELVRSRISVFSNVDTLMKQAADQQAKARAQAAESGDDGGDAAEEVDRESSYSVVYEANGRCEPYVVKIWKEGAREDDAMVIGIGRFGRPVAHE
ncbi:MAG: Tfp pilus assembly protein FimT/FimU [Kiritimatiellia bacterium]